MYKEESTVSKEFLRITEVARLLGVHHATVRRWIHAGILPCVRPTGRKTGKVALIPRSAIERLVQAAEARAEQYATLAAENGNPQTQREE